MKTFLKRGLLFLAIAVVLAAGGLGARELLASRDNGVTFRTAPVEKGPLVATISATGTIEPEEVIDVGAQVAAFIKNFGPDPRDPSKSIDYGSPVHKDTLLAQLDDSLFKARVEQAQAAVEVAQSQVDQAQANIDKAQADLLQMQAKLTQTQRDWERAINLRPSRAIADVDYDTAKANYETADANLKVDRAIISQARAAKVQAEKTRTQAAAALHEAEVNLGYTQIRSPVEGVIVDRRVNVGQTVVAGLNAPSLFLIAKDLRKLQVWASVNEADIGNIHENQPVTFTVDAFPKQVFKGLVAQIRLNASMTQNVVTYTVVVATSNYDGKLLPYMTANLQFQVAEHLETLMVPNAALRWRPRTQQIHPDARAAVRKKGRRSADKAGDSQERGVIWVPDEEFVRPVSVRLGLTDGAMTEILGTELQAGSPVVVGEMRANGGDSTENPFAPKMFGGQKKQE
jgi:HlyD family secretion protein